MKLLKSLLFCLMVHGIDSYKYYYKKVGNGFEIIYAQHEFGGYTELKSPKSLKVSQNNRGERPGVCNYGPFYCSVPYQRSATQHFECTSDYQCPRFFKCCQPPCFVHRVCQPAYGIETSNTLLPQPTMTNTFSPATFTETQLTTSSDVFSTESTTTYFTTREPPEPEAKMNLEITFSEAREQISTELTTRKPPETEPTETDEMSKLTPIRDDSSTGIFTMEPFELESPASIEITASLETTETFSNESTEPAGEIDIKMSTLPETRVETSTKFSKTEPTPVIEISTSRETRTDIVTRISTIETQESESPANIEKKTSSKTTGTSIDETTEPAEEIEIEMSTQSGTRGETSTNSIFRKSSKSEATPGLEISSTTERREEIISRISTIGTHELESPSNIVIRNFSKTNETIEPIPEIRISTSETRSDITTGISTIETYESKPTNDAERESSTTKIQRPTTEITTNTPSDMKSPTNVKMNYSSETKKPTTAGPTSNTVNNTEQGQEGLPTHSTMATKLANTSFGSESFPKVSAVEFIETTDTSYTSSYFTVTPTDIKMNTSMVESNNLTTLDRISDFGASVNRTLGTDQKKNIKTTEFVGVALEEISDKPVVTETSFVWKNKSTGYITKETFSELNTTFSGSNKKDQSSEVKLDDQRRPNISYTGQDDGFDENNVENPTKFPSKLTDSVNSTETPTLKVSDSEKHTPLSTEENDFRGTSSFPTDDEDLTPGSGDSNSDGNGSGDGGDDVKFLANVTFDSEPKSISEMKSSSETKSWLSTEHTSREPTNVTEKETSTEKTQNITTEVKSIKNVNLGISEKKKQITAGIDTNYTSSESNSKNKHQGQGVSTTSQLTKTTESHNTSLSFSNDSAVKSIETTDTSFTSSYFTEISSERYIPITTHSASTGTPTDIKMNSSLVESNNLTALDQISDFGASVNRKLGSHHEKSIIEITEVVEIITEVSSILTEEISKDKKDQSSDGIGTNESNEPKPTLNSANDTSSESRREMTTNIFKNIETTEVSEDLSKSTKERSDKTLFAENSPEFRNKSTGYNPKETFSQLSNNISSSDKNNNVSEKVQSTEVNFEKRRKENISHADQDNGFDVNNVENATTFPGGKSGGVNKSGKPIQKLSESEKLRSLSTEESKSRRTSPYPTDDEDSASFSGSGDFHLDGDGSGDSSGDGSGDGRY